MLSHSLRNRLIAAFIGLALIPLLVAGGLLGRHTYVLHVSDSYARQQLLAQRLASELKAFLERFELHLKDADDLSNFAELERDDQHHVLSRLLAKQQSLREIWFLDETGGKRVHLSKSRIADQHTATPSQREILKAAQSGDRALFGPIHYDSTSGEPLMVIALLVNDPNSGKTAGALGAEVRVKAIWELVSSLKATPGEDVYILDAQQRIIAHRNPSVVLRETRFRFDPDRELQAGLSGEEAFIASYAVHLGGQSFTVVVERAAAVALAPALTGLKIVGGVTVFALAIALALFYAAVRQVVVPICEVAAAARAIRDGNLERRVAAGGRDEIGDLAASFNDMTAQLRATLEKLQAEVRERLKAEAQIRHERDFRQAILDTANTIIVVLDRRGYAVGFNHTAETITGYCAAEVADKPFWDIFLSPEEAAPVREVFDKLAAGNIVARYENYWVMRDGSRRLFDWSNAVLLDDGGNIENIISIGVDITERNQAVLALKELNTSLEQRVRQQTEENLLKERLMLQQSRHAAMGEMISAIAHQWRQPLNALAITLANLKDSFEFGELDQAVMNDSMANSNRLIQKMSTTIDDFRNFFRPRQLMEKFQVDAAIRDAVKLVEASLSNNSIVLTLDCEEDIEAYGAANELGQVVLNLIVNAKEACLERKVAAPRIAVVLKRSGEEASITVEDNAGGIDPQVGERIFDPYFTTKMMGTGIGLYMARIIVERHLSGRIAYTNTGDGTRFTITFPLQRQDSSSEALLPVE